VAVFGLIFKARRKFIGLGIVLVFGLVFLAVAPSALLERWRTIQTARTEDESAQQRFRSWYISGRIIRDHPLVGVGTRNILLVYDRYSDPNEQRFVSHNAYLQIATDAGIPALLLFLSILGVSFVRLRKTRRILRIYAPDSPLIKYSHGIEVGLYGYMTSAMFASRQDSEMLFAAIALATSFVIIAREYEQEAKTREFVRKQSQQFAREPRALAPGLDAA
jgi:O-antigen ligase